MGGDQDSAEVENLAFAIKLSSDYPYKTAWYSGKQQVPDELNVSTFDLPKMMQGDIDLILNPILKIVCEQQLEALK